MQNSRLAVILLLLLSSLLLMAADEEKKPYANYLVTVTSSSVNGNGVRLIYGHGSLNGDAKGKDFHFVFRCNDGDSHCSAPAIGQQYVLIGTDVPYTCDDYILDRYSHPQIVACLDSVH